MKKIIWDKLIYWVYKNSFWTGIILGIILFFSLMLFGCSSIEINPQPPKLEDQAIIQIYNSTDNFYTVTIKSGDFYDYYVLKAGEATYINLVKKSYKFCFSKEFEIGEDCKHKIVNGDDKWTIRKK